MKVFCTAIRDLPLEGHERMFDQRSTLPRQAGTDWL